MKSITQINIYYDKNKLFKLIITHYNKCFYFLTNFFYDYFTNLIINQIQNDSINLKTSK